MGPHLRPVEERSGPGVAPRSGVEQSCLSSVCRAAAKRASSLLALGSRAPQSSRPFRPTGVPGVPFLLVPSLWASKEKELGCRAETRHRPQAASPRQGRNSNNNKNSNETRPTRLAPSRPLHGSDAVLLHRTTARSEERRVGKEGRS